MIPAGKYLSGLVKTGKTAGIVGVKTSLKTAFQEGGEQGLRNIDSLKGVLKNAKSFGDNIFAQVKTYGKQLDNFARDKVISVADNLAGKLRQADEVISDAAQNFRLNFCMEPQLVSGAIPSTSPGRLSGMADNLQAFAKNLDGGVDEVVEAGSSTPTKLNLNEVTPSNVKFSEVEIASYNRKQILKNIEESRLARKSSNFDDFLRKEYEFEGKYFPERVELANGKRGYLSADSFDGQQIPVRSREFVNAEGHIKWPEADGFVTDSAGNPITEPANLKAGQMIDRYGPSSGRFTSPLENGQRLTYEMRGLPYPEGYQDYHQYKVVVDLTEENILRAFENAPTDTQTDIMNTLVNYNLEIKDLANVRQGEIAKVFGQGGGTQIQFGSSVSIYEDLGLLREVTK